MLKQLCFAVVLGAAGCATTSTTSTVWTAGPASTPLPGRVEAVREVVQEVRGDPAAGAVVGALIGGILFHGDAPSTLFGAATGAAIGAAASSGSAVHRVYEVHVRFDNGEAGVFVFEGMSPFRPGDFVALTPNGLVRR